MTRQLEGTVLLLIIGNKMLNMIGIDYTTAPVDIRAKFSVRKSEQFELMDNLKTKSNSEGIVLLSTCNRVEVWSSEGCEIEKLLEILCDLKQLEIDVYDRYFIKKSGDEAKRHLFFMACGLKSAMLAEDQILSQVKDAIDYSRENGFSDSILQMLFKSAITVAKKVKTQVKFQHANTLAIEQAVQLLKNQGFDFRDKQCMVIGNGAYGKLSANVLVREGCQVTVTIRQYHSGEVQIPDRCDRILYGDKYKILPKCQLIISATASPNYTLYYKDFAACELEHNITIIDLAVPRDVDPEIGKIPGVTLYDIDDFRSEEGEENKEAILQTTAIIEEGIREYDAWFGFRTCVPQIERIREDSTADILSRLTKPLRHLEIGINEKEVLKGQIESASGKVISNIFYHLRDTLSEEEFKKILEVFEKR